MKNKLTPVRVVDVIYSSDHPLFNEYGGWNGIGTVFYTNINVPFNITRTIESLPTAIPGDSNITTYPIKNEIVYILDGPSPRNINTGVTTGVKYWISRVNMWNSIHHNVYPSYLDDNSVGITFNEVDNVDRLIPLEGDTILQSRFGSSIRLGSTNVTQTNPWSDNGETGDPIITLTTRIPSVERDSSTQGVFESPDDNGSGIFITSTQKLPINIPVKLTKVESETALNQFVEPQVFTHTSRIVNHSRGSIFNIASDVVYTESDTVSYKSNDVFINSNRIYLGENATQRGILGDNLYDILSDLLTMLFEFNTILSTTVSTPPGTPLVQVNTGAIQLNAKLQSLKVYLRTILANKTYIE